MDRIIFISLLTVSILFFINPITVFARVTPEDIYQTKRAEFERSLIKIEDPVQKQLVIEADQLLGEINQIVCDKFDINIARMSAILEEEKSRQNITDTVVAYGRGSTRLDSAAYYLNYAAEALAYQRIQDYTPSIGQKSIKSSVSSSSNKLKSDLKILQGKILRAKTEMKKVVRS